MDINYTLIRQTRKTAAVRISISGEVTLCVPRYWTDEEAARLIRSKGDWIKNRLALAAERASKKLLVPKGSLLYLGEIYTFEKNISMGRFYKIDEEKKIISSGYDLTNHDKAKKFYKERADFMLPARVRRMAEENGFSFAKAVVRNTKSRWGSCTSKKIITMSERLILAPVFVIDAIALHELVHTEIMNHSCNFYARLNAVCPHRDEAERYLIEKFPVSYPPD